MVICITSNIIDVYRSMHVNINWKIGLSNAAHPAFEFNISNPCNFEKQVNVLTTSIGTVHDYVTIK